MKKTTVFRSVAWAVLAMGVASSSMAGANGLAIERIREQQEQQRQSQPAPAPAAPQEQTNRAPPRQPRMESGPSTRPDAGRNDGRNDARGERRDERRFGTGDNSVRHHIQPGRVFDRLPQGRREHRWNGQPYYQYGGSWYRPYGSGYMLSGAPYGLFVSSLPGYYNSFWFGSSRYFLADDTYYLYEPTRRGYVVTRSPYDNDRRDDNGYDNGYEESNQDEDLFIYPARGQSDKQQADDRYECHRWAANESNYDPTDSDYDAKQRAAYLRAMTACLTGRGYSVR